jgi:uncharacterized protein (TIGR03067 family)
MLSPSEAALLCEPTLLRKACRVKYFDDRLAESERPAFLTRLVMRCVFLAVFLFSISGLALADDAKKQAITKAMETFAGTWEVAAVKPEGATKDARRLVFNKDGTYAAVNKHGKELWAGTFEIDPTATPKIWDHRSNDAQKTGTDVLGIYELEGDDLKVSCVVGTWKGNEWTGKARPKGFDPKDADVVIELKRVKVGK